MNLVILDDADPSSEGNSKASSGNKRLRKPSLSDNYVVRSLKKEDLLNDTDD
jgi:hypothetical protein